MKVLVTGGCGFLGSNIASFYLDQGAEVFIIDALFRLGSEKNKEWLNQKAAKNQLTIEEFDVANKIDVEHFFKTHGRFDRIAHLAGQVAMTTSMTDPYRDFLTNVVGTFNILEATRHFSPDATLIYSSTNKVYGELKNLVFIEEETRFVAPDYPRGLDETYPLDFSSPYGCSKGAADQYMRDWHRNFGLKTIVFRHSSIFGGRQFSTFDQGWVGWFIAQALEQEKRMKDGLSIDSFTIAGNGKQVRDVLHAEDLVRLYHQAFEIGDKIQGEIFNIGGGMDNSLSLLELFHYLEEILKVKLLYKSLEWRHSDQKIFVADIGKVKNLIQWSPQLSKNDGIVKQLVWIKNQHQI
ncbi:GDP-mannose 4,6-dehydratase [Thermosynechococcaceae cyanobacterium BACA0444]|uniref:GDP-mannose 4,6-dehydratase n=1 Tax=Pseudocalidococcus azoricus BACA0444 TaxID=2918990 RepID=A0AAE4FPQ5_9CYAN|nr:NAD-dependent epimerase/dehydratase family protein [Pseudocalidococcus azoricus]MDS3859252.1 GDP-mannose 4,6-dehydratase [Pseudocalidococcus azoricus BACA0444]